MWRCRRAAGDHLPRCTGIQMLAHKPTYPHLPVPGYVRCETNVAQLQRCQIVSFERRRLHDESVPRCDRSLPLGGKRSALLLSVAACGLQSHGEPSGCCHAGAVMGERTAGDLAQGHTPFRSRVEEHLQIVHRRSVMTKSRQMATPDFGACWPRPP